MNSKTYHRYYCTKEHLGSLGGGTYHYSDEVIYDKHLEPEAEIQLMDSITHERITQIDKN